MEAGDSGAWQGPSREGGPSGYQAVERPIEPLPRTGRTVLSSCLFFFHFEEGESRKLEQGAGLCQWQGHTGSCSWFCLR